MTSTAVVVVCVGLLVGCTSGPDTHVGENTVSGVVVDADGPVTHATVRIQGTRIETSTDREGLFSLSVPEGWTGLTISAWKHGYYCAKIEPEAGSASDIVVELRRYQTSDDPNYLWMPPVGEESCMSCKPQVTAVWLENDAHAGTSRNPRFLTTYNGEDVKGNRSPPTRYAFNKDYGRFPLAPDTDEPYYGPGYLLDFPETEGNCACCHIPGAALDDPYGVDPNSVDGVDRYGVHCDFCHKVADVLLDSDTGLPEPDMPGVLSMDIRRPFTDDPERSQLFFVSVRRRQRAGGGHLPAADTRKRVLRAVPLRRLLANDRLQFFR